MPAESVGAGRRDRGAGEGDLGLGWVLLFKAAGSPEGSGEAALPPAAA